MYTQQMKINPTGENLPKNKEVVGALIDQHCGFDFGMEGKPEASTLKLQLKTQTPMEPEPALEVRQRELNLALDGYERAQRKVEAYQRILTDHGLDVADVSVASNGIAPNQNRPTKQSVLQFAVPKQARNRDRNKGRHERKTRAKQLRNVQPVAKHEQKPKVDLKESQSAAAPADTNSNTEQSLSPERIVVRDVGQVDWFEKIRSHGLAIPGGHPEDQDLTQDQSLSLTPLNSRTPNPPSFPKMQALNPTLTTFSHKMARPNVPYRIRFRDDVVVDPKTIVAVRTAVMILMFAFTFYFKIYRMIVSLQGHVDHDWEDILLYQVAVPLFFLLLQVFLVWFTTKHLIYFLYYRCEYNFIRALPSVTAYDARQDVHSRADMLHQEPLVAVFRLNKQLKLDLCFFEINLTPKRFYEEIRVSIELLAQVSTMHQHSLVLNKKDVAHRIHAACGSTASININRFGFLEIGARNLDLAMNTAFVGYGLFLERLETSLSMPFPTSQL